MKLGRLHHVGVAVPSMAEAVRRHVALGGQAGEPFDLPEQGVRVCFVDLPNTQVELLEPLGEGSPVARFLQRNPAGGQHHLCYEVPGISEARAWFEGQGKRLLGEPRIGAHGTPIFFLHPADMGGVLTEIMEASGAGH